MKNRSSGRLIFMPACLPACLAIFCFLLIPYLVQAQPPVFQCSFSEAFVTVEGAVTNVEPGTTIVLDSGPAINCQCGTIEPHVLGSKPSGALPGTVLNILIDAGTLSAPDSGIQPCYSDNLNGYTFAGSFVNSGRVVERYTTPVEPGTIGDWTAPIFLFRNNSGELPWFVSIFTSEEGVDDSVIGSFFVLSDNYDVTLSGNLSSIIGTAFPISNGTNDPSNPAYIDDEWFVSGDLNIDVPLTALGPANLGGRLQIYVAPGAQINITAGAIFTQTLADIRGCDFLHDGILVENGSIVMNNSSINDATTAIEALGNGLVFMSSSTFDNNYRGVFLNGQSGPGPKPGIYTCIGNTFDRTGLIKPFAVGQNISTVSYGINAVNAVPLALGLNVFQHITDGLLVENTDVFAVINNFNNLNRGVRSAFSSSLTLGTTSLLGRNFFTNVQDGATAFRVRNASIINNRITGGNRGIIHRNTLPNSLLNCNLNVIEAVTTFGINGISNPFFNPLSTMSGNTITMNDATNSAGVGINFNTAAHQNLLVQDNIVNLRNARTGINGNGLTKISLVENEINILNPALQTADCIHLQNPNALFISCNKMDRVTGSAAVGDGGTRGLFSASGSGNQIRCNQTNDMARGMEFLDASTDIFLQGNQFTNLFHGLEIGEVAWIGQQFEPNTDAGHGNRWLNNVEAPPVLNQIGAFHNSNVPAIVGMSRFRVNSNISHCGNPAFLPTNNQSIWFNPNLTCAIECGGACPPPPTPGIFTNVSPDLKDQIASGQINSLAVPTAVKAKSAMQLYRLIDQQPALLSNSNFASFKDIETNTTIGAFFAIEKGILNLAQLSSSDASTIAQQTANLSSKLEEVWDINQTPSPDVAQIKTLLAQASAASAQIQAIDQAQKTVLTSQIQSLKGQNAAISATETWEINQKTVNEWTLTVLNGDDLSGALAPAVLAIAEQCPLEGGDAVYQARGLYSASFDETASFDDKIICTGVGDRSRKASKADISSILVYPNPTSDALFVEGQDLEGSTFTLTNSFGQIAKSGLLTNSTISIADLASGLYTLTVQHSSDRVKIAKVLISR